MKKLSTILAAGTIALTMSTPVLAASVGTPRVYATTNQPDADTIAELEQASQAAKLAKETRTTPPLRERATRSISSCNGWRVGSRSLRTR
jgi:hypothetical protein